MKSTFSLHVFYGSKPCGLVHSYIVFIVKHEIFRVLNFMIFKKFINIHANMHKVDNMDSAISNDITGSLLIMKKYEIMLNIKGEFYPMNI